MPSPNWTPDVVATVTDGQNAGLEPELLPLSQFAYGRNLSIRGGRAHSRPSIVPLVLNTPLITGPIADAFGNLIPSLIQGASYFSIKNGLIIVSIAGRIFEIDPSAGTNTELTNPLGTGNRPYDYGNPTLPRHWYCETVGSIVIQDDQMVPYVYDGATWRNAVNNPGDDSNEVPVGSVMEYSNGRLAVAIAGGTQVMLGDIAKGGQHQSELKFTETFALLGGGTFTFPAQIKALSSLPVVDSASGQGSLVVGCRGRCFTLHTEVTARENWQTVGFQTEMFPNGTTGIVGPNAWAAVNQDLYFRSKDGLRSVRITYADYDSPGLTPISTEVNNRFDFDTDSLLESACVVHFDNRIFATHSPIAYGPRSIALGLVSLNFDIVSNRGQKNPPAYEGDWDGIQIAEIVKGEFNGKDRCFIIGRDINGVNGIWEILPEASEPLAPAETPTYTFDTRSLAGVGLNATKRLNRADIWVSDIEDPVTMNVYFRPDKYPYWILWDTLTVATTPATPWSNQKPIARGPFSTSSPPSGIDAVSELGLDTGFSFQVRLQWTGRCRVDYVQVFSEQLSAPDAANNTDAEASAQQYSGPPANQVDDQFWFPFSSPPQP